MGSIGLQFFYVGSPSGLPLFDHLRSVFLFTIFNMTIFRWCRWWLWLVGDYLYATASTRLYIWLYWEADGSHVVPSSASLCFALLSVVASTDFVGTLWIIASVLLAQAIYTQSCWAMGMYYPWYRDRQSRIYTDNMVYILFANPCRDSNPGPQPRSRKALTL